MTDDKHILVDPFYYKLIVDRSKENLRNIKQELEFILRKEFGVTKEDARKKV